MAKLTKKAIRAELAPLSKALLAGANRIQRTEMFGLKIECCRLYARPGSIGFAWHPHFTAIDPTINAPIGRAVHGGNLDTITDQLWKRQNECR